MKNVCSLDTILSDIPKHINGEFLVLLKKKNHIYQYSGGEREWQVTQQMNKSYINFSVVNLHSPILDEL